MVRLFVVGLCAIICVSLTPATPAAAAQTVPRRVLLLYSYEREFTGFAFAGLFRPELSKTSPVPIDFIEVSLQTARTSQLDPDGSAVERLRSAFGGRALDLVIPIGGPAAVFVQEHRDDLFGNTPVLLASVDSRFLETHPLGARETAVMVHHDLARVVDSILRVRPDTTTLMVVIGASRLEQFWLDEVKRAFTRYNGRLTFIWTNEWTFAEMIRQSAMLPPQSAIFYGIFSLDAAGVPQIETQTLDALHASANAPLFGLHSSQIGHGVVGGPLLSIEDLSRDTAAVARRLLDGEPASAIPARTLGPGRAIFDARELERWDIPDDRLEPASEILFRGPTLWQRDRGLLVVAISVLAAQVVLVGFLVVGRSRQARTAPADPLDLRSAETALSALTHRLMQAREHERAATAKAINDDVCQQLAALTLRLHAVGVETEGRSGPLRLRIEELCGQFWALERDIRAISDPLYHKLAMLGFAEAARAICSRKCTEYGVALDFQTSGVPRHLPDHVGLALFRVLEEAIDNALEHSGTSQISVTITGAQGTIALDVMDEGGGFDVEAALARGAVGLIGMRERMRSVKGACTIESRRGGGTRVRAAAAI